MSEVPVSEGESVSNVNSTSEPDPIEVARLVEETRQSVTSALISHMQLRGLTANPIMHIWVARDLISGSLKSDVRAGKAPDDANRPTYLRHLELDIALHAKGTVRKKLEDGREVFYMTKG